MAHAKNIGEPFMAHAKNYITYPEVVYLFGAFLLLFLYVGAFSLLFLHVGAFYGLAPPRTKLSAGAHEYKVLLRTVQEG